VRRYPTLRYIPQCGTYIKDYANRRNRVTRGLVEKPEDWEWSSFRHYATGMEGVVEIECSSTLLRIDKRHDRWTRRRGGYIVPRSAIPNTVRELKPEGMLALLLEPAGPYCDLYSFAGVTIPEQSKMIIEVVGAGFDASDILRGDIQPHERWEVSLIATSPSRPRAIRSVHQTSLVTSGEYRVTVDKRLAKIGARSRNPAFPDAELKAGHTTQLIEAGRSFLKDSHQTLLLKHANRYTPVPEKHVTAFARFVGTLLGGLSGYGIHLGSSSFAASLITKRGLTFWDFFPARRQEAASLYPKSEP